MYMALVFTLTSLVLLLSQTLTVDGLMLVLFDPVLQLLLGGLIIAKGLSTSGVAHKIANFILQHSLARRNLSTLLAAFALISSTLSLFISNTAVTAMLLPVGLSIIEDLKLRDRKEAIGLLLMLTWGSSVAVGILIGSPPNLIAQSVLAQHNLAEVGFFNWMVFAIPINILILLLSWGVLKCLYFNAEKTEAPLRVMRISHDTTNSCGRGVVILLASIVTLWFLPEFMSAFSQESHAVRKISNFLSPSNVAIGGALLMLIVPKTSRWNEPILTWREVLRIDWNTMFLFAGGLLIGRVILETGHGFHLGKLLIEVSGAESQLGITALMIALGILMSELTSNTASASVVSAIAVGIAQAAGVNPIPVVLGAAMGANFGFMMPISTPPNSIVYSSGLVPLKEMLRTGIIIDVLGFFVTLGLLRTTLPLLGWW